MTPWSTAISPRGLSAWASQHGETNLGKQCPRWPYVQVYLGGTFFSKESLLITLVLTYSLAYHSKVWLIPGMPWKHLSQHPGQSAWLLLNSISAQHHISLLTKFQLFLTLLCSFLTIFTVNLAESGQRHLYHRQMLCTLNCLPSSQLEPACLSLVPAKS